jgi:SPFH domain/Band 7 family protein
MTDPSDFGGGGPRPPRPPRIPGQPGQGPRSSGDGPQLPNIKIPKKLVAVLGVLFLAVILVVAALVSGRAGIVEVSDREVAVIVNYVTGNYEVVNQPGYKIFIPFAEQAFKFDKSPQEFRMSGDRDIDDNNVSKLSVRANDGSNFGFEELTIQYQLLPSEANVVLDDSGVDSAFKQNWVRTFARSILRDEFGKYSAEEVADPSGYTEATVQAQDRLNLALHPHGIDIIEIITPKPKFEARYEQAIADRKVANQAVEELKEKAKQLLAERDRKLGEIERDQATDYELLLGTLEAGRIGAEKDAVRVKQSAEASKITELAHGQASEQQLTEKARGLSELARKEAEGLRARVQAVALRGEVLVREKLAEKFANIVFEIVPYRRDPSPTRIEHLGGAVRPGGQR